MGAVIRPSFLPTYLPTIPRCIRVYIYKWKVSERINTTKFDTGYLNETKSFLTFFFIYVYTVWISFIMSIDNFFKQKKPNKAIFNLFIYLLIIK